MRLPVSSLKHTASSSAAGPIGALATKRSHLNLKGPSLPHARSKDASGVIERSITLTSSAAKPGGAGHEALSQVASAQMKRTAEDQAASDDDSEADENEEGGRADRSGGTPNGMHASGRRSPSARDGHSARRADRNKVSGLGAKNPSSSSNANVGFHLPGQRKGPQ